MKKTLYFAAYQIYNKDKILVKTGCLTAEIENPGRSILKEFIDAEKELLGVEKGQNLIITAFNPLFEIED